MKHRLFIITLLMFMLLAGAVLLAGCQKREDPNAFQMFYLNEEGNGLTARKYELEGSNQDEQIQELIQMLSVDTGSVEYIQPVPAEVSIENYEVKNGILQLSFSKEYSDMSNVQEVLCRGAVAKTFLQLEGIDGIVFFVDDIALTDADGQIIGIMGRDSFIDNPGEEIQNIQETEITLYFASSDGKGLVKEVQKVYYSSNMSVEKLVLERLLKAPKSENAQRTIPEGTQLINVSVMDGICLVNFDNGFLNYNFDIAEDVVIYSIVDSLTELPTVNTVQISVNGDTSQIYREKFSLSDRYERNLDLVTEENEKVEVVDEAAPKGGAINNKDE